MVITPTPRDYLKNNDPRLTKPPMWLLKSVVRNTRIELCNFCYYHNVRPPTGCWLLSIVTRGKTGHFCLCMQFPCFLWAKCLICDMDLSIVTFLNKIICGLNLYMACRPHRTNVKIKTMCWKNVKNGGENGAPSFLTAYSLNCTISSWLIFDDDGSF